MRRKIKALLANIEGAILLSLLVAAFAGAMTAGGMLRGAQSMISSGALFLLHFWGLLVALVVAGAVFIAYRSRR